MQSIYNFEFEQLKKECIDLGISQFRVKQIWNWLYIHLVEDFDQMNNIDQKTIEILKANFKLPNLEIVKHQESADGTQKLLIKLDDGKLIETVLMKYNHGHSVCVTTQIGCAVGCSFCASGLLGLDRNLTAGEIVIQVVYWQKILKKQEARVSHLVVMGIGEPFNNYDNLLEFLNVINDNSGLNIGARHITVSTSGMANRIKDFAEYDKQVNLAVSLHAPNDKIRSKIMKINNAYNIKEVMNAIVEYQNKTNRRVSFEYIMLKDVNDSPKEALELVQLLRGMNCHVNLIPFNSVKEVPYETSVYKRTEEFYKILKKNKIQVTLRQQKGSDIDGACGQLRYKETRKNDQA